VTREPGPPGARPRHRLHNCGPTSREVFRTPAIGERVTFDLRSALLGWAAGPGALEIPAGWADGSDPTPARLVIDAAGRALRELEMELPPAEDGADADHARRCLAALVGGLRGRGHLRRLAGIAFHAVREDDAVGAPERTPAALQLATTLAVYAVYAPPLLLWSRTPSLRWLRGDTVISLQRFDLSPATGRER